VFSKRILFITIVFLLIVTSPSLAYQFGGELNTGVNALFYENTNQNLIYENVNLELIFENANFEITAKNNYDYTDDNYNLDISLKKAYIRHKFKDIRLTLGKQPVSWSFGSLINTVDYNLGAETLDQETSAKYVNALELSYPINWYSSLSLVNEFNPDYDKIGFRARTLVKDYDISLNYVNKKVNNQNNSRLGLSLKGDIGSVGIYGSVLNLNNNTNNISTNAYMLGSDYSYILDGGYGNRLYFQGEYHMIENNEGIFEVLNSLGGIVFSSEEQLMNMFNSDYLKILLGNVSYNINDFSSIGVFSITSLDDGSTALIPNYSNQLSSNTSLNINLSYLSGQEDDFFGSGQLLPKAVLNVELSYIF
jgi:hypothetical protein